MDHQVVVQVLHLATKIDNQFQTEYINIVIRNISHTPHGKHTCISVKTGGNFPIYWSGVKLYNRIVNIYYAI